MNVTPSYTTILIDYLPYRIAPSSFAKRVIQCVEKASLTDAQPSAPVELPVYYHPEVGPDLALYQQQGLSVDDVIALHTRPTYTVCAIGFAPGFAFMTDVAEPLRRPRHATPRLSLPPVASPLPSSRLPSTRTLHRADGMSSATVHCHCSRPTTRLCYLGKSAAK